MMRGQFWSEMMFVMEPIIIVIIIIIIWYLLLIWAAVISRHNHDTDNCHILTFPHSKYQQLININTKSTAEHKNMSIRIENCIWPHLSSWSPQPGLMRSACSNQSPHNASLFSAGRGRSNGRPVKDNGDLVSVYLHIFYFIPPFLVAKAVNQ